MPGGFQPGAGPAAGSQQWQPRRSSRRPRCSYFQYTSPEVGAASPEAAHY